MDKNIRNILKSKGNLKEFYDEFFTGEVTFDVDEEFYVQILDLNDILLKVKIDYESAILNINWKIAEELFKQVYEKLEFRFSNYSNNIDEIKELMTKYDLTLDDLK